jgi:hypothetical protein
MGLEELADSGLTDKQIRTIGALITSSTLEEAAQKVGIGRVTIWRWKKMPEFNEALQQAKRQLYKEVWAEAKEQWQKQLTIRIGRGVTPGQ